MSWPPGPRPVGPAGDFEPELDLARRAFGPFGDRARARRLEGVRAAAADGRYFGVFDGPDLVASALYYDLRQWWLGRPLPVAGVASVKVAPEHRGRGLGRALVTGLLPEIAGRRYPLAVLYPATSQVYRSAGWELAGGQYEVRIPARSLRGLLPPELGGDEPAADLRRAAPDDAERVIDVLGRAYQLAGDCGPATFDVGVVRRWLDDRELFGYLAADGFSAYRWAGGNAEILVECLVAASARTTRSLWSVISSHGSIAGTVRACLGPADPVGWLTRESDVRPAQVDAWMLRVIDAAAAVAGRGFPAGTSVSARLLIEDRQLPANSGCWELEVGDGEGKLSPAGGPAAAGGDPVRLGARGFAALYAGVPMATLRRAGLAAGAPGMDAALDAAFTARPYLLDNF